MRFSFRTTWPSPEPAWFESPAWSVLLHPRLTLRFVLAMRRIARAPSRAAAVELMATLTSELMADPEVRVEDVTLDGRRY